MFFFFNIKAKKKQYEIIKGDNAFSLGTAYVEKRVIFKSNDS